MGNKLKFTAVILFLFLSVQAVQAGTLYLHDHPSYWWYVVEQPAFSAIVPSKAETYNQRSIFGMEVLEMIFPNGAVMQLHHQTGKDIEPVRASIEARYKPLVKNITLISNQEITTSNNLKAHFYAYEALDATETKVMLRSVFFQKGEHIVYFTMFLESDQFKDDTREYWIRAVNGFEWD